METKKLNIAGYLDMVNSKYSGFDGSNQISYHGADGMDARMMSPQAQEAARAADVAPYQVSVVNSTLGSLTALLFGYNVYQQAANYGSAVGLVVTPSLSNVSYIQLLSQSASQPFETSKIRITSTNAAQVTQPITFQTIDASGRTCTDPIITAMYFSPNQYQSGMLEVPVRKIIDGNTFMTTVVFASTTVVFTFFPAEKVNTSRVLGGSNLSPIKMYSAAPQPIQTVQLATRV